MIKIYATQLVSFFYVLVVSGGCKETIMYFDAMILTITNNIKITLTI